MKLVLQIALGIIAVPFVIVGALIALAVLLYSPLFFLGLTLVLVMVGLWAKSKQKPANPQTKSFRLAQMSKDQRS